MWEEELTYKYIFCDDREFTTFWLEFLLYIYFFFPSYETVLNAFFENTIFSMSSLFLF